MSSCYENYDPCFPDQPVVDLYLPTWASQPSFRSKPAFVWAEEEEEEEGEGGTITSTRFSYSCPSSRSIITYGQLNSSVDAMATRLLVRCLQRGDTILLLCPPGLRLVKLLFACQRAGLVSVPIIPPDPSSFFICSSPAAAATTTQTINNNQRRHRNHLIRVVSQTNPKAAIALPDYISAIRRLSIEYSSSSSASSSLPPPPPDNHQYSHLQLQNLRWLSVDDLEDDGVESGRDMHSNNNSIYSSSESDREYVGRKPDEVYLIQYTSGATGMPKPVLVSAGAAAHNVRAARKAYDLQPSSVIVSWLPQYHDCGLMFLLLTVVAGATCVLTSPAAFVRRPRLWLELITEFKATCTPVPSFALPLVMSRERITASPAGHDHQLMIPLWLGSLRNLVLVNEPIYRAPVEEFVHEFAGRGLDPSSVSPSYGLAENCTFVSTAWGGASTDDDRYSASRRSSLPPTIPLPSYQKLLPCAKLAPAQSSSSDDEREEMEIVVVNQETCEPVEDGIEGEIWVSSPSNASGYLGHPSLTGEVFYGRLQRAAGRRSTTCSGSRTFIRTGDRGIIVIIGDGEICRYLYVMGRTSDLIRASGNVRPLHPHYLETAASACHNYRPRRDQGEHIGPIIRGGCVAAFEIPTPKGITVVAVVAELRPGGGVRPGATRRYYPAAVVCEWIREAVLGEKQSVAGVRVGLVVLVESGSIPKTTSGKLQRWAAKEKLLGGEFPVVCEVRFGNWWDSKSLLPYYSLRSAAEEEGIRTKREVGGGEGEEKGAPSSLSAIASSSLRLSLLSITAKL